MPSTPRLIHQHYRHRAMAFAAMVLTISAGCGGAATSPSGATANASSNAPEEFGLSRAELAARIEETERLIAKCMTTSGFEYVALDFVTIKHAMDSDQTAPGVASNDYVKQFGLGITTQFDQPIVTFGAGPRNNSYLTGLAPADQVAFKPTHQCPRRALHRLVIELALVEPLNSRVQVAAGDDQPLRRGGHLLEDLCLAGAGVAQPTLGTAAVALVQFAGFDRALG